MTGLHKPSQLNAGVQPPPTTLSLWVNAFQVANNWLTNFGSQSTYKLGTVCSNTISLPQGMSSQQIVLLISGKRTTSSSYMLIFFFSSTYQMAFKQSFPVWLSSWENSLTTTKRRYMKEQDWTDLIYKQGPLILYSVLQLQNSIFLLNFLLFKWCSHFVAWI